VHAQLVRSLHCDLGHSGLGIRQLPQPTSAVQHLGIHSLHVSLSEPHYIKALNMSAGCPCCCPMVPGLKGNPDESQPCFVTPGPPHCSD
jgi:hypothetical protein